MSLELIVNGKLLEVSKSTPMALTFVANDLAELRNRQSNRTNRFKIPLTRLNREILELPEIITSETLIPYRSNDAIVIQEGVQIVPEGLFEILQVQDMIEAQVISGNASFFDKIKDKNINDISGLSDFNHTQDFATVVDSRFNTAADGYIYPIINYGNLSINSNDFDVRFQPAAIFFKVILDGIFRDAGFTKSGGIFTKTTNVGGLFGTTIPIYNNLIIPYTNDGLPNVFNNPVDVAGLLPDMTQTDFVKAFMQMFGLFPITDQVSKNVDFFQLQDVVNNQDQVVNWSDKMDTSRKPLIKYSAGSYGQVNRLRYKQDDSDINFGAGILSIDDETIIGEKILFELPFAPTRSSGGVETVQIPLINKLTMGQFILSEFGISTSPRVLLMRRGDGIGQLPVSSNGVRYTDNIFASQVVPGSEAPYCHFDYTAGPIASLSFKDTGVGSPNGLIGNHYGQAFESMFTRPKSMTQLFNLDQVDISAIDHRLPVFIESISEFFYLDSVNNYIGGRLTSVNLRRL